MSSAERTITDECAGVSSGDPLDYGAMAYRLCRRRRPSSASVRAFSFCPAAGLCRFLREGARLLFELRADVLRAELIPVLGSSVIRVLGSPAQRAPLSGAALPVAAFLVFQHFGAAAPLECSAVARLCSSAARHSQAHVSVFLFALRTVVLRGEVHPVLLSPARLCSWAARHSPAQAAVVLFAFPTDALRAEVLPVRSSRAQTVRDFGPAVLAAEFLAFLHLERDAKLRYWRSVQRAWPARARAQGALPPPALLACYGT